MPCLINWQSRSSGYYIRIINSSIEEKQNEVFRRRIGLEEVIALSVDIPDDNGYSL